MKLNEIILEETIHTGCMIGLWIHPVQAEALAQPGGESASDLHITLAYLGKGLSRSLVSRLAGVCATYAAMRPPMVGRVTSSGRFPPTDKSEGREVLFAKPEITGLLPFREGLVRRLENAGASVARDFEYNPHITLAYVAPGTAPLLEVRQVPLRFSELVLAMGTEHIHFPLAGEQR